MKYVKLFEYYNNEYIIDILEEKSLELTDKYINVEIYEYKGNSVLPKSIKVR